MAAEEYKIGLQVETSAAERSLKSLQTQFARMQSTVKNSTNLSAAELDNLTKMMAKTQAQMKRLESATQSFSASSKKLDGAASQSTATLANLSRVAQDAPFGFMGIANNLNPLVESFQRLRQETGSNKDAFKSLLSSMTGPAGIGLAIGVVSALLVKFGDDLFKGSAALYDSKKAAEEYTEALSKAEGQAKGEIATVGALINVVKDETLSREQRFNAIKKLQDEYPAYFKNVGNDLNNTKALEAAYTNLAGAIQRKAQAQALENLLSEEYSKRAKIQAKSIAENITVADRFIAVLQGGGSVVAQGFQLATNAATKQATALSQVDANIANYTKQLQQVTTNQFKFNDQLDNGKAKTEKLSETTKILNDLTAKLAANQKLFAAGLITEGQFEADKVTAYTTALKSLAQVSGTQAANAFMKTKQSLDALNASYDKMAMSRAASQQGDIANIRPGGATAPVMATGNNPALTNQMKAIQQMNEYFASDTAMKGQAWFEKINKEAVQFNENLANVAADGLTNMVSGLVSGELALADIGNAFKQILVDLGLMVVKALAFKAIMTALNLTTGGAAGGIGGLISGLFGFATGGIVTGPTAAMIGEGTEAEAVLPLSQLDALLSNSGGNMPYVLSTSIRGSDLQLVMRRADQQGRFTGNTF